MSTAHQRRIPPPKAPPTGRSPQFVLIGWPRRSPTRLSEDVEFSPAASSRPGNAEDKDEGNEEEEANAAAADYAATLAFDNDDDVAVGVATTMVAPEQHDAAREVRSMMSPIFVARRRDAPSFVSTSPSLTANVSSSRSS